jgi:hypothetical protein
MEIDDALKLRIIQAINNVMKSQSICDAGIDLKDSEVQSVLAQDKGGFCRELFTENGKIAVKVKWNKKELLFTCSIAILKKQKDGKWHCETRFDDAHNSRHCDMDFHSWHGKFFDGDLVIYKAQCPLLCQIINSLPKEKVDEWKIRLFKEYMLGESRQKERFNVPSKYIHSKPSPTMHHETESP